MKKIIAIIREDAWQNVIEGLEQSGVRGASVSIVKGYGEYLNPYRKDGLESHAKIVVFAEENDVNSIVEQIIETAHTGLEGDGIVSVMPVEQFYRIRSKTMVNA